MQAPDTATSALAPSDCCCYEQDMADGGDYGSGDLFGDGQGESDGPTGQDAQVLASFLAADFTYGEVEEDTEDPGAYHEDDRNGDDADDEDGGKGTSDPPGANVRKRKEGQGRKLFATVRGGRIVGKGRLQEFDLKAEVQKHCALRILRYCFLCFFALFLAVLHHRLARLAEIATKEGSPGYTKR